MKSLAASLVATAFAVLDLIARAEGSPVCALSADGTLALVGVPTNGVVTVESAATLNASWLPERNIFTSNAVGQTQVPLSGARRFYRVRAVDIPETPAGFDNLVHSYGVIHTIAGSGAGGQAGTNYWQEEFEGGPATAAALSRPHFAQADNAGNVFIVDKDSHSVLKVTTDGRIVTVAGTHVAGFNGAGPSPGTDLRLNSPNGLWVRGDSTVYILDTGNGAVRRLSPNGVMRTLFKVPAGITGGRGLWVADDESLAYVGSGTMVVRWTPADGVKGFSEGYTDLGNFVVGPDNRLVVTDRGANRVYRLSRTVGNPTPIAGNGQAYGGGDGFPALETGLAGVRGVWFLPTGGYLLATHEGSQVWYVDTAGIIHLFADGSRNVHLGDGDWFYSTTPKVSECRSVALDPQGNVLIVENDLGYVRRIRFLPFLGD